MRLYIKYNFTFFSHFKYDFKKRKKKLVLKYENFVSSYYYKRKVALRVFDGLFLLTILENQSNALNHLSLKIKIIVYIIFGN